MTIPNPRKLLLAVAVGAALPSMAAASEPSWTGGYFGLHGAYAFQPDDAMETVLFDTNLDGTFDDTVRTAAGADAFSPGFCGGRAQGSMTSAGCTDDEDGIDVGARVGYDWARGSFVFGVVGEGAYGRLNDGVTAFSTTPASYTHGRKLRWLASARARVGWALGGSLVYATGGGARGGVDHSFATTNVVNTFTPTEEESAWGYQVGGGVEFSVGARFRVGAEYLFTSLEDDDFQVHVAGPAPATNPFIRTNPAGTDMRRGGEDFTFGSARLVASYRF